MTPIPGQPAPARVSEMFARIAGRYDLLNTLMTTGMDRGWRAAALQAAAPADDAWVLDVGTGTARLAAALQAVVQRGRVVGIDFSWPMLQAGHRFLWRQGLAGQVSLVAGDGLAMPFADATFDCLTSAFMLRNLPDLEAGFREQVRVVKPAGNVVCLELTWPTSPIMRASFGLYFGRLVPILGGLVAGNQQAYAYLPASVRVFPSPEALAAIMRRAGLSEVRWRRLGLGAVALHVGRKARPA